MPDRSVLHVSDGAFAVESRLACESATVGLAIVATDGRCQWVNSTFCEFLGYRNEELLGMCWHELTLPADVEHERARLEELKSGAARFYHIEKRWRHKSGHTLHAYETVSAIPDLLHGIQWLCQIHPVAETGPSAEVLEAHSVATVAQIAAGVAHEGRNALQHIEACSEILTMDPSTNPVARELVNGVQAAAARLKYLFDDLCGYALTTPPDCRPVDLAQIWRAAWKGLQANHPRRLLTLREHIDTHPRANGSARLLEQVFRKIFENALEACSESLEVDIRCWASELRDRPALAISVHDSGAGFAPLALDRAFEPFFTTKTRGIGLGLPIVRRIVELHGGQARLVSAADTGALLEIILPREQPPRRCP